MSRRRTRLLPGMAALGAMAFAAALLLASPWELPRASAGATDLSSVTCADVYLIELQQPVEDPEPHTPGDPVPNAGSEIPVAIALTRTQHNTGDNTTASAGQTYNSGIPGVIAGTLPFPNPVRCAAVDKVVATVTSAPGTPGKTPTLSVSETGGNPPAENMLVYWNSDNADQRGFYVVTAASAGSVSLQRTNGTCNNEPASFAPAPGQLHSCLPVNKGLAFEQDGVSYPLAYANPDVVKNNLLGNAPRPGSGSYDKGTNTLSSVSCSGSTGASEGAAQNAWTRTEIYTVPSGDTSGKTPSYGIAMLFNPTEPKTCADIPGETKRSTNVTVVWPLDSVAIDGPIGSWDSDYDKDGCLDYEELAWPQPVRLGSAGSFTGGRDPFNPHDCGRNFSSIWGIEIEAAPVTLDLDNSRIPGAFFRCRADVQHDKVTNGVTARVYCYTDAYDAGTDLYITVNEPQSGESSCPPAPASACGDGFTGSSFPIGTAPPPPPYGPVGGAHVVLNGLYDKISDSITIEGCYTGITNALIGPNAYVQAEIDPLTGHGTVDIWLRLDESDCTAAGVLALGPPQGPASPTVPGYDDANIQVVELAAKGDGYDFDLDGCPDKDELSDVRGAGGLRDPYNRWDYFEPTGNGQNRVNDILAVVAKFGLNAGDPEYTEQTDRTRITGSNAWNLGPPNGQQRVDDIINAVNQFGHDCS